MLLLLHRAWQNANRIHDEHSWKLTRAQYALLSAIEKSPGLHQRSYAQGTSLDRSTLSEMVHRMVECKYIESYHLEGNRKSIHLDITPEGKKVLEKQRTSERHIEEKLLLMIPPSNRNTFLKCLSKLAEEAE